MIRATYVLAVLGLLTRPCTVLSQESQPSESSTARPGTSTFSASADQTTSDGVARSETQELGQLERRMLDLMNRDRLDPSNSEETQGKARPLAWNEKLAEVARAHSRDMIVRRFFSHLTPGGLSPDMRLAAAGISWDSVAENIAKHYTMVSAEAAFMNEPHLPHNHRGNILNPHFTQAGVGIARGPDGMLYVTQEFIQPAEAPFFKLTAANDRLATTNVALPRNKHVP